jgi:hypothetical protein
MNRCHATAQASCPACRANINATTGITTAGHPAPGDFTICAYCQTVLIFEQEGRRRIATDAELAKQFETPGLEDVIRGAQDFLRGINGTRAVQS